jgi:hypothetical protein
MKVRVVCGIGEKVLDWGKFVDFVRMSVWDAGCCISNGSHDGDKKSREGCFPVITITESATAKWEMENGEGKWR